MPMAHQRHARAAAAFTACASYARGTGSRCVGRPGAVLRLQLSSGSLGLFVE